MNEIKKSKQTRKKAFLARPKEDKKKFTKTRLKKIGKILGFIFLVLFILYTVIGFWGVPLAMKWAIRHKVPEYVKQSLHVKEIHFNPFSLRLKIIQLEVFNTELQRMISFDNLVVDVSFVSLIRGPLRFEDITLDGLYVEVIVDQDGQLNLLELIPEEALADAGVLSDPESDQAGPLIDGSQTKANTPKHSPPSEDLDMFPLLIDSLNIINGSVYFKDQTISPPFEQAFRPINTEIKNLSTIKDETSDMVLSFHMLNGGVVSVGGKIKINPLKILLDLSVEQMALSSVQSYIENYLNVAITEGRLSLDGEVYYDGSQQKDESLSFKADMKVTDFQLQDASADSRLLQWHELSISAISFLLDHNQLTVGSIIFDQLVLNPVLDADGLNVLRLVKKAEEQIQTDGAEASAPDQEDQQKQAQGLPSDFAFSVEQIQWQAAQITFTDRTLVPVAPLTLDQIQLDVKGITSLPEGEVLVAMTGQFKKESLLKIDGSVRPFKDPVDVNLTVELENYVMPELTFYFGRFLGYTVASGTLDLDLDYEIGQNQIKARHKILLDTFRLGEKVDSEEAVKLPIKLALSLLEDINNKIKITLPVNGDLSDPEFKYSHIIRQTFANFFIKIVAKPFTFLASAMGGGEVAEEDMSFVYFEYGEAHLMQKEKEKLRQLVEGLRQRPKLLLDIQGTYDEKDDWWALKTQAFKNDYANMLKEHNRSSDWIIARLYQRSFSLNEFFDMKKQYKKQFEGQGDPNGWERPFYAELRRQLIENAPANKEALTILAQARAQAVYEFLIEQGGLEEKRLRLKDVKKTETKQNAIPLELNLTVFASDE